MCCPRWGAEPLVQDTPSGGCHYLFVLSDSAEVRNSASRLAPSVDIRGEGGYIVVAPSVRADGRRYVFRNGKVKPAPAPAWLVDLLQEAAEAFTVPLQIPAACLLGVLSCLVGGTRLISLRPSWREPGNIWIAIVAASGLGKTPCAAAFFNPIKRLEHEAFKQWQEDFSSYENEVELVRKERARAKRGEAMPGKPIQPKRRQAYIDDATVEVLGDVLSENPRGLLWRKDELSGLIADLDKYASGSGGGTRARLLSSYDGQEWKTSRTSNPTRNLYIPQAIAVRLSSQV